MGTSWGRARRGDRRGNGALRLLAPGSTPFAVPIDTHRWAINVNTTIAFDTEGGQIETIERQYLSHYGGWFRSRLAAKTLDERQEWLLENYHNKVSTGADPDVKIIVPPRP